MKTLILKATSFCQLVAVIALLLGAWDAVNYWQRNGEQPVVAQANELFPQAPQNRYVELNGGLREITNTYEVLMPPDDSAQPFQTDYYVPVVVHAGDEPQLTYLIKQQDEPVLADLFRETRVKGYLSTMRLPADLEEAFRHHYHFTGNLLVLDTSYLPLPVTAKWMLLILPMTLLLLLIGLKHYLTRGFSGWWQRWDDAY
ncbi:MULTISPECIES: hypothetical protein [Corallincola]|uniref:Uncharacterized protein n=3 Tax=Corallincola TaxID=1775176 RepID=A0A368NK60_9GAMM|nr:MULTISPECIES: hypothetical protein [Corallincola]RCU50838.1 hypothetical protein DU002_05790 [Corallincola holothuriorum]TAA45796.1 hypothetical protein EXY25_10580 [Corallincola spongiicola]TCI03894.1 hypothetical protein EZV61_06780 [Corallincola luteus]